MSVEAEKRELGVTTDQYSLGFNAGIDMAIAILTGYADGQRCIFCGDTEHVDHSSYACTSCGFRGY